jgi:hypothetical protein
MAFGTALVTGISRVALPAIVINALAVVFYIEFTDSCSPSKHKKYLGYYQHIQIILIQFGQ